MPSTHPLFPRTSTLPTILVVAATLLCAPSGARAQDVDSIYRFGITQLEEGDVENAINTFRKVLELDPNYALAHSSLGYIYLRRGNVELAGASFDRALQLDENLAVAHNGRGLVLARDDPTRQRALVSFRQALELEPEYLDAFYNLGITLAQLEDYNGARQALEQVLSRDPDFSDVHYQQGVIASKSRDFDLAEQEFVEQYRRDPNHRENRLELGRVYYLTERYAEAEDMLLPLVGQYSDYVPAMLLLADVYLSVEDYSRANQLYLMSYREFDDPEIAERLWQDVVDITYDWERKEYRNTPPEEMSALFRRFWKRRDPNPTDDANEVLVEHYRRLRYARQYYRSPTTSGGYDDRGRVYIRHGEPDNWAGFPAGDAETKPNLSWEYHTGRKERIIIHFVDRGYGYFEQVLNLAECSMSNPIGFLPQEDPVTSEDSPSAELWVDMLPIAAYRDRAILDPIYDQIANMMEELIQMSQAQGGGPDVARTYQERLETLLSNERMENMRDISTLETTDSYVNILPPDPLPFHFYTAAFKDIQGRTRIEVYYGVPTSELGMMRYGEGQKARVNLGIAMFDDQWNEIASTNEIREFVSAQQLEQAAGDIMVDLNRMLVRPGTYNFAISVTDLNGGRVGVYRDSLYVEDFSGRNLAISDIEMAGKIVESRRGGRFYREGVEIIPMPNRTFTTEQQIYLYYEIYNLEKDQFGTTVFQISYSIAFAGESRRRNILSSAFRALGSLVGLGKRGRVTVEGEVEYGIRATENKYLEVTFPSPSPGIYRITLTVKDMNNGTTASRIQEFMVTPPPQ